jgi:hypothetical protein
MQGMNYGWCRYNGWSTWISNYPTTTANVLPGDMALIHQTGKIGAVRIWIFPDGTANVNLTAPVASTFVTNLQSIVKTINDNGMSVYLTFFNSWDAGYATSSNEAALWTYDVAPILSAMKSGGYNIYGVDMMNEFDGGGNNLAFVTYLIGQYKSAGYTWPVTASTDTSASQAGTDAASDGATMIDFHIYENGPISMQSNTSGLPGVIGEFGGGSAPNAAIDDEIIDTAATYGWKDNFIWDFGTTDAWTLANVDQNFDANQGWTSVGADYANGGPSATPCTFTTSIPTNSNYIQEGLKISAPANDWVTGFSETVSIPIVNGETYQNAYDSGGLMTYSHSSTSSTLTITATMKPTNTVIPPSGSDTVYVQFGFNGTHNPSNDTYSVRYTPNNTSLAATGAWGSGGGGTPPSAPTGLTATAGNSQVALSWNASSGATSYNVYRSTSSGGEGSTPIASGVTSTSYTNTGLTNGTTYYYKVAAVNTAGTSGQSTEASATPAGTVSIPPTPSGLTATAGNGQVSLSWQGSSGATSYNVYRSTSSGGEGSTPVASGVTTTTYTNTGLTNGTTYYYKVAAVNNAGTSGQSNEASATPAGSSGGSGPLTFTASAPNNGQWYTQEELVATVPSGVNVTACVVTINDQLKSGDAYGNMWTNTGNNFTLAHNTSATAITFTFTQAAGTTVSSGQQWWAQINSSQQQPVAGDTYAVTYTTNGTQYTASGVF